MAIGNMFLTRLTPAQVRSIKSAMLLLDDARVAIETSAESLPEKSFGEVKAKLRRSAEGVKWERAAVDARLNELLDKGKKIEGCCATCGCSLEAARSCDLCGWTRPGTLPEIAAAAQS
jgi:hypothetical protein